MKLFPNQQKVYDTVITTKSNYFITGKPGVGKSVLINELVSNKFGIRYTLAAPTGLAALNINGKTLHSIFRIPIFDGILEHNYNEFCTDERTLNNIKYNVKQLIIDEISMVRSDIFDYIDRYLQYVKKNAEPFGGIQVIGVGDFYQLPPVAPPNVKAALYEAGYETEFAFSSKVWATANFQTLELNEVRRQSDPKFISLLHSARDGKINMAQCGQLNEYVGKLNDLRISLCGINAQADSMNKIELNKIDSPPISFVAKEYGKWEAYPVEKVLTLKIGAQVMVKQNGADLPIGPKGEESNVVNGTLGIVQEFVYDVDKPNVVKHVIIKLENGSTSNIYLQRWEKKIKDNIDGVWEEKVVATFEQMPLALAWAISMHKSQGQSFDKVYIDPSKVFTSGQLYVAVSRCRSLEGLKFAKPVSTKLFKVNGHVVSFYKSLKSKRRAKNTL